MAGIAVAAGGALVSLAVWLSVLRTVFVPRERSTLAARSTVRTASAVCLAVGRRAGPAVRRRMLDQCAPVALFLLAAVWFAGVVLGLAMLAYGVFGVSWTPRALDQFYLLRSAAPGLAMAGWLSGLLLLATFSTYLISVNGAYGRRERFVGYFAAEADQPRDADVVLAAYVRTVSRDRLDTTFAEWAGWMADVQITHLGYPALCYCRPVGRLCWARAALIALDSAALVRACAPEWAPPNTYPLLVVGGRCLQRIAAQMGIRVPLVPVSHQGREEWPFSSSMRLAAKAGLRSERSEEAAYEVFQSLRVTYAPYATAIAQHLLYRHEDLEDPTIPGKSPERRDAHDERNRDASAG